MLSSNKRFSAASSVELSLPGSPVYLVTLTNQDITVVLTNLGNSIVAIYTPDRYKKQANIVAGFTKLTEYFDNFHYLGCTLGRYAGRIGGGVFKVDGTTYTLSKNDGDNHLHGGFGGLGRKVWSISFLEHSEEYAGVCMSYTSPDGEDGYPGDVRISVEYRLTGDNRLTISYLAETNKSTPLSLSNHSYFNLSGFTCPHIFDHTLHLNAKNYLEKNGLNLPSGKICPVEHTGLDFSHQHRIGDEIDKFPADGGFDHTFVLNNRLSGNPTWACSLYEPASGRELKVYTDQPSLQLYSANYWDGNIKHSNHGTYIKHGAVAIETQSYPDSPNHPGFPDTVLRPGKRYNTITAFEFNRLS